MTYEYEGKQIVVRLNTEQLAELRAILGLADGENPTGEMLKKQLGITTPDRKAGRKKAVS